MRHRGLVATLLGLVIGGTVVAVLFAVVGFEGVVAALVEADPTLVVLVGALLVGWTLLRALALAAILRALDTPVGWLDVALVTAGAGAVTHLLPFGQASSEPVVAWLLTDVAETDFETGLASVASLDALTVIPSLVLATLGLGYYAVTTTLTNGLDVLAAGVLVATIGLPAGAGVAWRYRRALQRRVTTLLAAPVRWLTARLPMDSRSRADVRIRVRGFVAALERVAADRRRVAIALACTSTGWACQALALWTALLAVGTPVAIHVPFFVVPIGATAKIVPTPGGIGGIETANTTLLALATGASPRSLLAGVTLYGVGGFVLAVALGAAAIVVIRVRGARRARTRVQR